MVVLPVVQIEKQVFSKIQHRSADVSCCSKVGIIPEGEYPSHADVWLKREEFQRPKQLWISVLRPCSSTGPTKAVNKNNIDLVPVLGNVDDIQAQWPGVSITVLLGIPKGRGFDGR